MQDSGSANRGRFQQYEALCLKLFALMVVLHKEGAPILGDSSHPKAMEDDEFPDTYSLKPFNEYR